MSVTVPDEFESWPFEARRFVLAEANGADDLRRAVNDIVGLPNDHQEDNAASFTKDELAAVLMALGGPEGA
jgi:hypothetical protein